MCDLVCKFALLLYLTIVWSIMLISVLSENILIFIYHLGCMWIVSTDVKTTAHMGHPTGEQLEVNCITCYHFIWLNFRQMKVLLL